MELPREEIINFDQLFSLGDVPTPSILPETGDGMNTPLMYILVEDEEGEYFWYKKKSEDVTSAHPDAHIQMLLPEEESAMIDAYKKVEFVLYENEEEEDEKPEETTPVSTVIDAKAQGKSQEESMMLDTSTTDAHAQCEEDSSVCEMSVCDAEENNICIDSTQASYELNLTELFAKLIEESDFDADVIDRFKNPEAYTLAEELQSVFGDSVVDDKETQTNISSFDIHWLNSVL